MIQKTIREFYILSVITSAGMGIISTSYVAFLLSKGLNLFEANLINVFFYVTLCICEIPTGAFADIFGRKMSYIVSCVFMTLSGIVYGFSDSFWGFALAEIICAFGATFASGAFTAWYVDKLKHQGFEQSLSSIFSRCSFYKQISNMIFSLLGGYVAFLNITTPWFLFSALFVIAGCVALTYKEEYFVRKSFSWSEGFRQMKEVAKTSCRYGFRHPNIRFILIVMIVQSLVLQGPNMQWQPFFSGFVPDAIWFGYIKVCISLSLILGSFAAPRILRKMPDERMAINLCQMIIGLSLVVSVLTSWLPSVFMFFMIHEVARGAFRPIADAYMHDSIDKKDRATIESFQSLANHGGGVAGLLFSGFLGLHFGISWSWGVCGGILVCSSLILIKRNKK